MSRSYKHYPHIGLARSEKFDKRLVNKGVRRRVKTILTTSSDFDDLSNSCFPLREDIKDVYDFAKDGGIDLDPNDIDCQWGHYYINGKLRK